MRQVLLYESSDAIKEQELLKKHQYMLDGYEEWKEEVQKVPFSMRESDFKQSRYRTHLLYEKERNFPFTGYLSSKTHKDEKACRIVWDVVYSNERGEKIDKLSSLGSELQQLFTDKIEELSKQGDTIVLIYVVRSCINYHDNTEGTSLQELDKYLTAFEDNYKKHHKGRLPDSLNFLDRVLMICQRIL